MNHVVLLGDSIFDNGAYVPNQPDVIVQVQEALPSGHKATLLAKDGAVTRDVKEQLERLPQDATHLVLSVGGNDALGCLPLLQEECTSVADALIKLAPAKREFQASYHALLVALVSTKLPITVATIYDSNFEDELANEAANVGVALFNDVITREAAALKVPVMDLRVLFNSSEDYANAIEPSTNGGQKIAHHIREHIYG